MISSSLPPVVPTPNTELTKVFVDVRQLTVAQLDEQIKQWKASLDAKALFSKLAYVFRMRDDRENIIELLAENEIDFEGFIASQSSSISDDTIAPDVCCYAILRVLSSSAVDSDKQAKIATMLKLLSAFSSARDRAAKFLAHHCPSEHIRTLFIGMSQMGLSQTVIEPYLIALLRNPEPNFDNIRNAFAVYWTCWEHLSFRYPLCEWVIKPYIKREEILDVVVRAIPNDDSAKRAQIIELLKRTDRDELFGQMRFYALGVSQQAIDRIVR